VTVLDASALVGFFLNEPSHGEVAALLRRRPSPSISAVNLAEVIDQLVRVEGRRPDDVNDAIDLLIIGGLEVQPYWLPNSRRSALGRAVHYDRNQSPLSLADCACLATAIALKTDLATTDTALAAAARADGLEVIALPNSKGMRPSKS
jgi:PIN domain nuclease of toxin-antitoxin system